MSAYGLRQFEIFKLRAMFQHAEIISGAYKLRKTQRGVESGGWRDLTDDEKLQESMACMQRHIHFLDELSEVLAKDETST